MTPARASPTQGARSNKEGDPNQSRGGSTMNPLTNERTMLHASAVRFASRLALNVRRADHTSSQWTSGSLHGQTSFEAARLAGAHGREAQSGMQALVGVTGLVIPRRGSRGRDQVLEFKGKVCKR